jgi:hypothetical protein
MLPTSGLGNCHRTLAVSRRVSRHEASRSGDRAPANYFITAQSHRINRTTAQIDSLSHDADEVVQKAGHSCQCEVGGGPEAGYPEGKPHCSQVHDGSGEEPYDGTPDACAEQRRQHSGPAGQHTDCDGESRSTDRRCNASTGEHHQNPAVTRSHGTEIDTPCFNHLPMWSRNCLSCENSAARLLHSRIKREDLSAFA